VIRKLEQGQPHAFLIGNGRFLASGTARDRGGVARVVSAVAGTGTGTGTGG
jgi:hypothetical protein